MKKLALLSVAFLVCAAVGNFIFSPSKAQTLTVDSPAQSLKRQTFTKLINAAARTGTVRVIVGLDTNFQAEGNLRQADVAQQRLNIKQAQAAFANRFQSLRVAGIKQFEFIPFVAFETDAATLGQMQNDPRILSIEEDELTAPTLLESTAIVGAPTAWASGFSGAGQAVAVLDTGVNKNHNFLTGKVISEACYSSTYAPGNASSVCPSGVAESTDAGSGMNCDTTITGCAHGTHVAGIVAGRGTTFSGVAKDASLIAIEIFSRVDSTTSCGSNPSPCALAYTSDEIKGLERVRVLRDTISIAAVNMSLGGGRYYSNCDAQNSSIKAAIDNLRSVGVATVISSGNGSYTDSMSSPACISSAISVGSTDDGSFSTVLDLVSDYSNSVSFLTLLAPGRWINSSVANGTSNNTYQNYAGTSMSAPHVAAAYAILKQRAPNASVTQITNALVSTGQPITDARNNVTKPRIKIAAALNVISNSPARFDYDGDGKSDVSVFRPSNGAWYLQQSTNGFTGVTFGISTDRLVPADFDGDGKTDVAVYRGGTWYLQRSQSGFLGVAFGASTDIAQPADFDGDGKAELAVYRPSNGTWYIYNLANNQTSSITFGASEDKPVAADYDGDGKADIAVFRPSSGVWYVQRSTLGFTGIAFGNSNDKPAPADYDGDGKTDVAVFRPSTGTWYLQRSQLGFSGIAFGLSTDQPAPADYDGDGKADIAVFRSGTWYLQQSQAGFTGIAFGAPNDLPTENAFVY